MHWLPEILKRKKSYKLKERGLYACTAGERIGFFYLPYETNPVTYDVTFIILPDFESVTLTHSTVTLGLSSGVLDLVQVFKPKMYDHVCKEFEGRKNEAKPNKENN